MYPPPTGPIETPSGTGQFSNHSTALAISLKAVAFILSFSKLELAPSIKASKDGAEMNSITRYVLPCPSAKTSYTRATRGALGDC